MDARRAFGIHRLLLRSMLSGVNTFLWVLIFSAFAASNAHLGVGPEASVVAAFVRAALLYTLVQVLAVLILPSASRLARNGVRRNMAYGTLSLALSYGVISFWMSGQIGDVALIVFVALLALHRVLYRVPYTLELHTVSAAPMRFITELFVGLMPLVVGVSLMWIGVSEVVLMWGSGVVVLVASLFVLALPEAYEGFSWKYQETFLHLFSREHHPFFFRSLCDGVQSGALFFLWPLTVFLIVGSSFLVFGAVLSTSILLSFLVHPLMRESLRSLRVHRSPLVGAVMVVSGWIVRTTAASPLAIIFIDTYGYATARGHEGVDMSAHEQTADASLYLDESTVLKEMGLGLGRIFIVLCAVLTTALFSVGMALLVSFILAGLAAGATKYL